MGRKYYDNDTWLYGEGQEYYRTKFMDASKKSKQEIMTCLMSGIMSVDSSSRKLKRFMIRQAAKELEKHVADPHLICKMISDVLVNYVTARHVSGCLEEKYKNLDKSKFAKMQAKGKIKPEHKDSAEIIPLNSVTGPPSQDHLPLPRPECPGIKVRINLGKITSISGMTYLEAANSLIPLPFNGRVALSDLHPHPGISLSVDTGVMSSGEDKRASSTNTSGKTIAVIVAGIPNTNAVKLAQLESSISGHNIVRHSSEVNYTNYIVTTNFA